MKQRRKLVRKDILIEAYKKKKAGVPVSRLLRDYKLNITLPHLIKLLAFLESLEPTKEGIPISYIEVVHDSLFPKWLKEDGDPVQLQPWNTFRYFGTFPTGSWVEIHQGEA